jgi:hypothetical protein
MPYTIAVYLYERQITRHYFVQQKHFVMSTLIIGLIAGIIMGFSFDNVMKLLPEEIRLKPDNTDVPNHNM